ncbi:HDOD domain-containing protein [endosymbiont of Riftia pachyptila]|uniref:Putative signal transduction protein n=1 Tax=endosymbiont of Riftia pachyptila (vent Ph05) TaxID=1048808 RepID=G2DHA5_9GAMM|nr:HDOD domain-containing protein [endosymbiont of Riftia pachyptila]EGV50006.1 putative signal transduction protein [endosymbiont of Riftia pachyptila (vent Ph05)]
MSDALNSWLTRLANKPLPALQRTLTRVRDLLNKPNASHSTFAAVVQYDPGFSLYLFQQLNRQPNRPREPICNIHNALPLIGMGLLERAVIELTPLESQLKGPARRGLLGCYSRAAHAAIYAESIAQRQGQRHPKDFATAALLHELAEMSLWLAAPEQLRDMGQAISRGDGREDAALETFGFTLEALNLALGGRWELPELVQESQRLFNSFQPKALSVMLCIALARSSAESWSGEETQENIELLGEFLNIPEAKAQALSHQIAVAAAHELYTLPLPLTAFSLARAVATAASRPAKAQHPTPKQPPRLKQTGIEATKPAPTPQAVKRAPPPAAPRTTPPTPPAKPTPTKPAKARPNPLQTIIADSMRELKQRHGMQRIMFSMLTPDRKQLKARFVIETGQQPSLKDFQAPLTQTNIFTLLLQKPQPLWLRPDNMTKYLPLIPEQAISVLGGRECLMMSIFFGDKPIGVLYADKGSEKSSLSVEQFANFKALGIRSMKQLRR